jgi:hypothetical protein
VRLVDFILANLDKPRLHFHITDGINILTEREHVLNHGLREDDGGVYKV